MTINNRYYRQYYNTRGQHKQESTCDKKTDQDPAHHMGRQIRCQRVGRTRASLVVVLRDTVHAENRRPKGPASVWVLDAGTNARSRWRANHLIFRSHISGLAHRMAYERRELSLQPVVGDQGNMRQYRHRDTCSLCRCHQGRVVPRRSNHSEGRSGQLGKFRPADTWDIVRERAARFFHLGT